MCLYCIGLVLLNWALGWDGPGSLAGNFFFSSVIDTWYFLQFAVAVLHVFVLDFFFIRRVDAVVFDSSLKKATFRKLN